MNLGNYGTGQVWADESSQRFMPTDEWKGVCVDGNCVGDEVVEICGDGDFVLVARHYLSQHRIAIARFDSSHHILKKCITLFLKVSESALVDERIKTGSIFEIKTLDAKTGGCSPFFEREIIEVFPFVEFFQPLHGKCDASGNAGLIRSTRSKHPTERAVRHLFVPCQKLAKETSG